MMLIDDLWSSFFNLFAKTLATSSSISLSSLLKRLKINESISITPIRVFSYMIGTTISEFDALSHAIWPSNLWTSSTMIVFLLLALVPHTPLPIGI